MSNNMGIGSMLLRWRCSVYKVVYREFIIFLILFGVISAVYRNGLDDDQKGLVHFITILRCQMTFKFSYWKRASDRFVTRRNFLKIIQN